MRWPAALATTVAATLLLLLYLRSPIDLVPDRLGAIGLVDDLLLLVAAAWWLTRRLARARPRPAGPGDEARDEERWDPWAVLGLPPGASADAITRAYREQMKRYHPDRVADLGPALQHLAHRKALDIQRAYAELTRS